MGREGVAREIEVRDRLKHEVRAVVAQGGQRVVLVQGQLVEADARHGLADELARVGAGQQKLREGLAVAGGHAAAAADKVLNEAAAQAVAQGQRLRGQIGKIDDLHAAVAQHLRKAVMLRLRAAQVGNVRQTEGAPSNWGRAAPAPGRGAAARTFFSGRTSLLTSMAMRIAPLIKNF